MTAERDTVVELINFSYSYPGSSVSSLLEINYAVPRGSFIGFTGPTGAGKTTLIKALNGIIPHFEGGTLSGEVLVMGKSTGTLSTAAIGRMLGTVLDDPEAQVVCLDVEQEIAFGLENYGIEPEEMEQRIQMALARTGITNLRQRSTRSLSGGQKQRLAIAAAVALMPEVLVLDEPTSELDPLGSEEVFEVLKQLNQHYGITVLVVEQKSELLARYCDQLVVMYEGRIILAGPPKKVFKHQDLPALGVALPQISELALRLSGDNLELPVSLEEGIHYCREFLNSTRR